MTETRESLAIEGVRFFGEMSASISHEIKNVLAIVKENAGLLQDLVQMREKGIDLDPERLSRVAASILRQVDRGDRIVKEMNRFAHSADLPKESLDLTEIITFMPELAARLIAMRGTTPRIDLPASPVKISTNRFFLENLVWRCLCQAMAAAVSGQALSITADMMEGGARIRFGGLDPTALADMPAPPDDRQALVAALLDARVAADAAAGTLEIQFYNQT